jgi:uncharacterized membrane protein
MLMTRIALAVALSVAGIQQALAGAMNSIGFIVPSIPTLDEVGLIGISVIVGIAAGIAARRRKKK